MEFVRTQITQATTDAVYGPNNPSVDPKIHEAYWYIFSPPPSSVSHVLQELRAGYHYFTTEPVSKSTGKKERSGAQGYRRSVPSLLRIRQPQTRLRICAGTPPAQGRPGSHRQRHCYPRGWDDRWHVEQHYSSRILGAVLRHIRSRCATGVQTGSARLLHRGE